MSIHFAAAKTTGFTPASAASAKKILAASQGNVANDNGDKRETADRVLRAALCHFAEHGLGAARVARAQAQKAFFDGDRETYDWWLGITRTLDRRLAESVSKPAPDAEEKAPKLKK
ncbi:hypothetical protein INR77_11600 [Erythrobacter sp. SCSIO 43205]|uniref:hypothetical protein n=1 Tax=Erythrobacter sp. SCSIO 43205 TaxID=2779361 RepID=UPI001CA801AE|nr:hypothetical protein [Erythrobacter sp. SCSIO 43205]UAB77439.1 hypothetical protein INR77_11600 [Erythrobacter sp. SCSIO 43205]